MSRTINFDFTTGPVAATNGRLRMAGTRMFNDGPTIVLPPVHTVRLVGGLASIEDVEPTPVGGAWSYQVKLETEEGAAFWWIVTVPDLTTPVNFNALPVLEAISIPIDQTGTQIEAWMMSVRAQATAANNNALLALQAVEDMDAPLAESRKLPPGGTTGQVLTRSGTPDFEVEWVTPEVVPVPPGTVQYVTGDANVLRPTPNTNIMVIYMVPGSIPPATALPGIDIWVQIS